MGEHFFHTDGRFTLEAPEGELVFEAMHGFESRPTVENVHVTPSRVTFVTLKLKPMTDMKALGWHSGSNHVHMNYGGNLHNTPANLLFMAEAEDVDVVTDLIANKDNRVEHPFPRSHPHYPHEFRRPAGDNGWNHVLLVEFSRCSCDLHRG